MRSLIRCALLIALAACADPPVRDVTFAVPAGSYALDTVRLIVLEDGQNTSLDEARFELRGYLTKSRAAQRESEGEATIDHSLSSPAFYPAPSGYAWFSIEPAARVAVRSMISAEALALARVDDGIELSLRDFVIWGEEEYDGERALRLEVLNGRRAVFESFLERARGGQILFVVPGHVLLAVDVRAPVRDEFWLLGLPERGESEFVDRMSRGAIQPR